MTNNRKSIIRSLIPDNANNLLDVGCGPIFSDYAYADKAKSILCVDWNLTKVGDVPPHIKCASGDFNKINVPENFFDVIVAADVFEHVQIEREREFIDKCISALRLGGSLILSVPHRGTFAWLDPYEIKPLRDRIRHKLGSFTGYHNGNCDIRKGHKHYTVTEITDEFAPLQIQKVVYWGYLYDPLLSWAYGILGQNSNSRIVRWLERRVNAECERDFGIKSFNMALVLKKEVREGSTLLG